MKIYTEMDLTEFEGWAGGRDTLIELTDEQKKVVQDYIEEIYPCGVDETELNDYLWFERDSISQMLGFVDFDELMKLNSADF